MKNRIEIVEDEFITAQSLSQILETNGFEVIGTADTEPEAVRIALEKKPDLIIMDINLKGKMDGISAAEKITREIDIPVIFLTAYTDDELIQRAKSVNSYGYLIKPIQTTQLLINIEITLEKHNYDVMIKQKEEQSHQLSIKLSKAFENIINVVATIVEIRDPYTFGHEKRVADLSMNIAMEMGLSELQINNIYIAAKIHDVGKIAIPSEILSKPAKLDDAEFMLIKKHPLAGYEILKNIEFDLPIALMIRQHHEWINGSGYPYGLKENEILLESKIITVADVTEAISSHRPYRPSLGIDAAIDELKKNKGKKYDPEAVNACLSLITEKNYQFIGKTGLSDF